MKKLPVPLIAAASWLIVSFVLLTLPGSNLPKEDWLDKTWIDKWVHIALFGILVFLWCATGRVWKGNVDPQKLKQFFIIIGVAGLGYGIAMEFVQRYYVSQRSFDIGDIVADAAGCVAGTVFGIRKYIKK